MTDSAAPPSRIAAARRALATKLGELRRRESRVRAALSPSRYLASPWLRFSLAAVAGYQLGRRSARARAEPHREPPDLLGSLIRAGVLAAAKAVLQRAVADALREPKQDQPARPDKPAD